MTCQVNAMLCANLASELLPQRVKRLVPWDTLLPQPVGECLKIPLAAIMRICRLGTWSGLGFDHKRAIGACVKAAKDFHELSINVYIGESIFRLRVKELCRLDANAILVPLKSVPFKFVDFVPTQARHGREKQNLQLFRRQFLLCSSEQRLNVEATSVAH